MKQTYVHFLRIYVTNVLQIYNAHFLLMMKIMTKGKKSFSLIVTFFLECGGGEAWRSRCCWYRGYSQKLGKWYWQIRGDMDKWWHLMRPVFIRVFRWTITVITVSAFFLFIKLPIKNKVNKDALLTYAYSRKYVRTSVAR